MNYNDEYEPSGHYGKHKDSHKKKKSGGSKLKIIFILVLAFLLSFAAGAAIRILLSDNNEEIERPIPQEIMSSKDKITVMIMGVDEREGDVGRSDTLMVATIDPKRNQTALLSIPRDTRVKIPGRGFDKINAAYAYGGHSLTRQTVESFLGITLKNYIVINIKSFNKIIDAIGGIDIDVEKRMYYEDPWDDDGGLVIDLYPGKQHMDGDTAITYVRYRDEEGDIGRVTRQQKFMAAIMDKVTSPSIIPRIPAIISQVISSIDTNMSVKQLLEFASALKDARDNGLKTAMVPGDPVYIDDISYWIPDIKELRTIIANTLDIKMSQSAINAMERDNREYQSLPDNAKKAPVTDKMKKLTNGTKKSITDSDSQEYKKTSKSSIKSESRSEDDEDEVRTSTRKAERDVERSSDRDSDRDSDRNSDRDTERSSEPSRESYRDTDYTVPPPARGVASNGKTPD